MDAIVSEASRSCGSPIASRFRHGSVVNGIQEFLQEKRRIDPEPAFRRDWDTHHERLLGSTS